MKSCFRWDLWNKKTSALTEVFNLKVEMTGFEPATPRPPGVYATRLRHISIQTAN